MLLGIMQSGRILLGVALLAAPVCAQPAADSVVGKSLEGEYSTNKAMALVYGNYDAGQKLSKWSSDSGNHQAQLDVRVLQDAGYIDQGVPKHLLVTWATDGSNCRACPVLIGMISFASAHGQWKIAAGDPGIDDDFGVWGEPPQKVQVRQLGPRAWGIVFDEAYFREDFYGDTIWVYGIDGTAVRQWLVTHVGFRSSTGRFTNTWCTPRLKLQNDVTCLYGRFDFSLHARPGAAIDDLIETERHKSVTIRKRWQFDGHQYVPAS